MVLLGVWLSCLNVTLKGKGFVKNIEQHRAYSIAHLLNIIIFFRRCVIIKVITMKQQNNR